MMEVQKDTNENEGSDPADEVKQQNPDGTTTADLIDEGDPQKTEKLVDPDGDHDLNKEEE